ncbi:protein DETOXIFICATION 12-like isoform X1 [Lycium ferocissimum]|uniref:protein DETOXIFICATION 12-like isoform X1 n=1 Tax=Lycium ferocissimum TaxID=112874 RepID=UPI0028169ABE|nr:protein DETOXIFICATION 12-like isoform X1 [Lycium ferocissimum]
MENIEEGLLLKERELVELRWEVIWEEVKEVGYLAGPMIAVTLSMYLLEVISMMMVGHLGELSLSSTSLALSLAGVTGFSFLLGMASALETLGGQAFGAKQYQRLGTQTYTAILSLFIVCIPLTVLWIYMGKLLTFIGQDPQISHEAGKFIKWLIPALFAYANLQPLIQYLQMQSMIFPMLISSCITICFHIPLSWVLVFCSGLGNIGAAVAIGISMWLNVIILASYMRLNSACAKTCAPMSWEIVRGMREFFRFAIPSAIMICLEWWSFELLILLSGLLPNPQLETSVLSICLNTISTLYAIPFGLSGAVSTRVSNQLGAGNPQGARVSVVSVMLIAATETILVSATLFACRNIFGYIFSNEKEVVDYVANMAPLLCLSVITDSLQGTLSGVARGCGWQHIGAYVNLASFYLCGIPIAASLAFWLNFRGKGLWIGILSGAALQTILLSVITCCTNWKTQAAMARERLHADEKLSIDNRLI